MNHWLRNPWIGRGLIVLLMAITLLPFLSMLSAALAPSGTYPVGISWPSDPQWGNFVRAFEVANMGQMMLSSLLIVAGVVPLAVIMACLAGFGLSKLVTGRRKWLYLVFVLGLTLPFESIITPLYYEVRALGLLNTRFAIILPLLGLYMPFSVYWMRAHFIGVPKDLSEAAQLDGATAVVNSGKYRCRWHGRRLCRCRSCCFCGPGTSSCCRWSWCKTRPSAPSPVLWVRFRVSGAPTCRCCVPAH